MVPDPRSCTMLSTPPLFYIAQSVNSDDRRWSSFFLKFQNKDLGAASQTLLTEVKLRLRRNLALKRAP